MKIWQVQRLKNFSVIETLIKFYIDDKKKHNIKGIRVEEVHDHEEGKHFWNLFYCENGKIEIMGK